MGDSVIGGRYRLGESLGGTMGQVFLAEDAELGRRVVVKLLGPDAERARFEREARAAATLAHENIVRIYAYGEAEDGRPFMVLEYLAGGTLEERLGGRPLADHELARVARDVAAGLAHAHARGLVHRDLKPANVLFDDEGRAKIADFGIARLGDSGTLTEAGTVMGTAAYISPEQAAGEPATPASDVYSFGVMLFRMLTGALPFAAERPLELVRMHQTEPAPSVSDLRPDVPARLESLVAAALAKDPADRPPDGAALLAELEPPPGDRTAVVRATPQRRRRRPAFPLAVAAVVLGLLAAAGIGLALIATHEGSTTTSTSRAPRTRAPRTHSANTQTAAPPPATTAATTNTNAGTTRSRPTTASATTTAASTVAVTTAPPVTTAPATTAITGTVPIPGG